MSQTFKEPSGPVQFAWFGGLMEGAVGEPDELGEIVRQINALGWMTADLEVDHGRFSIMFDKMTVPGERVNAEKSQRLVELLERVVEWSPKPETIESTLHGSQVHTDQVLETHFGMQAGSLSCLSRSRPIREGDLERHKVKEVGRGVGIPKMSKGMLAGFLALSMLTLGLVAWNDGWIDRVAAAKADSIDIDASLFNRLLEVEVEGSWGIYTVTVSRGSDYPTTLKAVADLEAKSNSTSHLAAIQCVAGGRTAHAQLQDKAGEILQSEPIELANLLDAGEPVVIKFKGHSSAKMIMLSLSSGEKPK